MFKTSSSGLEPEARSKAEKKRLSLDSQSSWEGQFYIGNNRFSLGII